METIEQAVSWTLRYRSNTVALCFSYDKGVHRMESETVQQCFTKRYGTWQGEMFRALPYTETRQFHQ